MESRDHTQLGLSTMSDGKPFTTLMYLNGPGYANHRMSGGSEIPRVDLTNEDQFGEFKRVSDGKQHHTVTYRITFLRKKE